MNDKKKISFYTLGCKVNQYETEALREQFITRGYESISSGEFADIYIINSCSVTSISDRKTRQYIRKTKKINPDSVTVLTGCYAETGADVVSEIDEIDIILGNAEKGQIFDIVQSYMDARYAGSSSEIHTDNNNKVIQTGNIHDIELYDDYGLIGGMNSRTRAYIKVEDGCDRYCSYCIIPHARGPVRSRPVSSILKEAELLLKKGYKELILTGINAALFGSDLKIEDDGISDLTGLLKELTRLSYDFRIRLSSLEPTVINAEYASQLLEIDKLCPHLHLSLQSGSDKILKSMGRNYTRQDYLDIVNVLKSSDPNYSITTDIIVGYPGETEHDFEKSAALVGEAGFSKIHVFKYSRRSGTPAADMPNQIPEEIKNERSRRLIKNGEMMADEFINKNRGTERQVLILEREIGRKLYSGITDNDINIEIESEIDISNTFQMITL